MKFKIMLKKTWDFIWNSNSWQSWVVNVILAFVLIKFIIYPGIGLLFGTTLPVVAVISESMEHPLGADWMTSRAYCERGPCSQEAWYLNRGISSQDFEEFPFKKGFDKGDIMIILGKHPSRVVIGDVIVFNSGKSYPIIHRVVAKERVRGEYVFETKGDNNPSQISDNDVDETNINEKVILGVAWLRIPYLGYIKIWFTNAVGLVV